MKRLGKILKRYPRANLSNCGSSDHKKGCYIKLTRKPVTHSEQQIVILDFDKNNNLVAIDLEI